MWDQLVDALRDCGVGFAPGLTDDEVSATEARFALRFPPDLRAFLQTALPRGGRFTDWRSGDEGKLRETLDEPLVGLLYSIDHGYWVRGWGPRPPTTEEARRLATRLVGAGPRLIPVYGHRMMPAEPHLPGNPVFSVHGADIIRYGAELRDYLIHEFMAREDIAVWPMADAFRPIAF